MPRSLCAGYQGCRGLDLGRRWRQTPKNTSEPHADHSHLSCLPADLRRDSEDVGGLLHDPDQQVVYVVFQLAHLELLLAYRLLLFEDQLDQLIMGQLCIGERRVRGAVLLQRGKKEGNVIKSVKKSKYLNEVTREENVIRDLKCNNWRSVRTRWHILISVQG